MRSNPGGMSSEPSTTTVWRCSHNVIQVGTDLGIEGPLGVGDAGLDGHGHVLMDRQEQLGFAAEVVVDAADAGAGCRDHLADGGGAVAALPENGNRGVENALLRRVGFGPAPPAMRRNRPVRCVTHRIARRGATSLMRINVSPALPGVARSAAPSWGNKPQEIPARIALMSRVMAGSEIRPSRALFCRRAFAVRPPSGASFKGTSRSGTAIRGVCEDHEAAGAVRRSGSACHEDCGSVARPENGGVRSSAVPCQESQL